MRRLAALALILTPVPPVHAGTVTSGEIKAVSVTLYRDPNRGEGAMDRRWPGGYALVTETRTITIPAGESVIRFEGVAEGLLPESAIVTGLPSGVREKNRDARLLSPAGLVDAYLARRVHLKRTNRATSKVVEQDAVIRAGPGGGVIVQTAEGFESLGCSGLPERMLYDGVPEGLSAKPTLSVLTTSDRVVTATVQLSYLAQGFDWSANYVAEVAEDGRTLDLFAWATIANGGSQGFARASTQAIAGQPNKESNRRQPAGPPPQLVLQCWPMDITSTHPSWGNAVPPPPPPPAPMIAMDAAAESIVVTGSRRERLQMAPVAMVAVQEELGDLKLYRIPEPVTIAAQSQKQVAMIQQEKVAFDAIYTARVDDGEGEAQPMGLILRTKNVKEKGLGLPLPAGGLALFEPVRGALMLAGEDSVVDKAIGEEIEWQVRSSPDVRYALKKLSQRDDEHRYRVTLTNARDRPVSAEIIIPYVLANRPKGLVRAKDGWAWRTTVPANGSAELRYRLKLE